jgi:hypothetical protein
MEVIHVCVARGGVCALRGGSSVHHHCGSWCEVKSEKQEGKDCDRRASLYTDNW